MFHKKKQKQGPGALVVCEEPPAPSFFWSESCRAEKCEREGAKRAAGHAAGRGERAGERGGRREEVRGARLLLGAAARASGQQLGLAQRAFQHNNTARARAARVLVAGRSARGRENAGSGGWRDGVGDFCWDCRRHARATARSGKSALGPQCLERLLLPCTHACADALSDRWRRRGHSCPQPCGPPVHGDSNRQCHRAHAGPEATHAGTKSTSLNAHVCVCVRALAPRAPPHT